MTREVPGAGVSLLEEISNRYFVRNLLLNVRTSGFLTSLVVNTCNSSLVVLPTWICARQALSQRGDTGHSIRPLGLIYSSQELHRGLIH